MNLKIRILTVLAFLQIGKLFSQYIPFVEESKYWLYYDFQARPRPTTGFLITIQGDTIVNGVAYKKVYKYELIGDIKTLAINEPPQFVADIPYKIKDRELVSLIREDINAKKVYNWPIKQDSCIHSTSGTINPCNDIIFCDTMEHLLFDFSLTKDDTLNYCSYAPLHYDWEIKTEKIDSINMEVHFGKLRTTFYTFGIPSYLQNLMSPGPIPPSIVRIIEGIGFQYQGIFHYRAGSLVRFCEGSLDQCNIATNTNDPEMANPSVKLFPNPTYDFINLEANVGISKMTILNLNGDKLFSSIDDKEIDLSSLPAGIYLCRIELMNGNILIKKIVKLVR